MEQNVEDGQSSTTGQDMWARWLLRERFGGNEQQRDRILAVLAPVRDRVLDGARLASGDEVLDVGCGDGLLALAAADRVGPGGRVVCSDVSEDLLGSCRELAEAGEVADRCVFVSAALPELAGIDSASVDAVVLRSVLIYVQDKAGALRRLREVLRPGGRLSLFEPINSFGYPEPPGWLWGFDMTGLEPLAEAVKATIAGYYARAEAAPMLGFDERDLLTWAQLAGFEDLALTYEAQVTYRHPHAGTDLATFLDSAPNPTVPTLRKTLNNALGEDDQARIQQRMADQLVSGSGRAREAVAYLSGRRGADTTPSGASAARRRAG